MIVVFTNFETDFVLKCQITVIPEKANEHKRARSLVGTQALSSADIDGNSGPWNRPIKNRVTINAGAPQHLVIIGVNNDMNADSKMPNASTYLPPNR